MNHAEEEEFIDDDDDDEDDDNNDDDEEVKFITTIATSDQWTTFRNSLAQNMFNGWRARVRHLFSFFFLVRFSTSYYHVHFS